MKKLKKTIKITVLVLVSLSILIVIASGINNRLGNTQVNGNIKGLGTTIAFVSGGTDSRNKIFFKLVTVFNDRFSFRININEPGGGRILSKSMFFKFASGRLTWMRYKIIDFNLNPEEQIAITGKMKPHSIDYWVQGNTLSEQNSLFRKQNLSLLEDETKTAILVDKLSYEKADMRLISNSRTLFDKIRADYNNRRLAYTKANPSLDIAATYLQGQTKDSIIKYFPLLTEKVRKTPQGIILEKRIKTWETIQISKPAPPFSAITISGKTFSLSDLKGKYVVLDFWGSWCMPCIQEFPRMKEYYKKYQKNVEFVGIACNDKEKNWINAVNEAGVT